MMRFMWRYPLAALAILAGLGPACGLASQVALSGRLTEAPPCALWPGDETVEVAFGTLANKDIDNIGSVGQTDFALRLINCDLTRAGEVVMTLTGTPSPGSPGNYLALDPGSAASGVAIALETQGGEAITLGVPQPPQTLLDQAVNRIDLRASVNDLDPSNPVVVGAFSATAQFLLEYQ